MTNNKPKVPPQEMAEEALVKAPAVYDKAKILTLNRYATRRDLLSALLEDGKDYTKDQVDGLIEEFMKGKVR